MKTEEKILKIPKIRYLNATTVIISFVYTFWIVKAFEKVQGTNHFTNILIYPEYNSLFNWNVITISWINIDDRPCDTSTDWCGWKNVRGWKRTKYREINQNHQDEIDEGNNFKVSILRQISVPSVSPPNEWLCQECSPDNLLVQNCESWRQQNNVEAVCDMTNLLEHLPNKYWMLFPLKLWDLNVVSHFHLFKRMLYCT